MTHCISTRRIWYAVPLPTRAHHHLPPSTACLEDTTPLLHCRSACPHTYLLDGHTLRTAPVAGLCRLPACRFYTPHRITYSYLPYFAPPHTPGVPPATYRLTSTYGLARSPAHFLRTTFAFRRHAPTALRTWTDGRFPYTDTVYFWRWSHSTSRTYTCPGRPAPPFTVPVAWVPPSYTTATPHSHHCLKRTHTTTCLTALYFVHTDLVDWTASPPSFGPRVTHTGVSHYGVSTAAYLFCHLTRDAHTRMDRSLHVQRGSDARSISVSPLRANGFV